MKKLSQTQLLIGTLSYYLVALFVTLISFFTLFVVTIMFLNSADETTSLSNVGFAIFAALASVCFGWARALNSQEEGERIKNIVASGELFLFSGIMFILASTMKYVSIHLLDMPEIVTMEPSNPDNEKALIIMLKTSNMLSIALALVASSRALYKILPTLIVRAAPWKPLENEQETGDKVSQQALENTKG